MNAKEWQKRIAKACKESGTYRSQFNSVIETLASIMELRDNALDKFAEYGGETVVEHTNKGGSTNLVKNPALVVIVELNTQALAYWRDLGLTPAGLKKINDSLNKGEKKESALEKALKNLGG